MRFLSHLFLGMSFAALFMLGCERHQFDKTKILHGEHGPHASHGDDHGKGHGEDKHKNGDGQAEKKENADKKTTEKKPEKKKEEPRDVGL